MGEIPRAPPLLLDSEWDDICTKGWCCFTQVEHVHTQLIAFLPEYTDAGNMTRLIYKADHTGAESNGHDPRQVESVKRNLANCYAVDLPAQTNILREKYQRRILLHFYLPDGRVFVPFKMRLSRISGDACYGYVDLDQVDRLLPGDEPSVILRSGTRLPLFSNISTASLAYFIGLEILSELIKPQQDADLDLVNTLAILRNAFAGQPQPIQKPVRRFRIKFLPIN